MASLVVYFPDSQPPRPWATPSIWPFSVPIPKKGRWKVKAWGQVSCWAHILAQGWTIYPGISHFSLCLLNSLSPSCDRGPLLEFPPSSQPLLSSYSYLAPDPSQGQMDKRLLCWFQNKGYKYETTKVKTWQYQPRWESWHELLHRK